MRTPSMVSEVSAMDVASTTLRRPGGRGRDRAVLRLGIERAEQRDHVGRGIDAFLQQRLGAADFGRARQEREDRARLGAQRARDGLGHLVLDARARIARRGDASRPERRGLAIRSPAPRPSNAATRAPSMVADITRIFRSSRRPCCASRASARPRSASSERSWNSSNSTAAMPLSSGSSRISRVNTPSVTTSMRVLADIFEPKRTRKPTVSPVRSPKRLRHAVGGGARRDPARFQHEDFSRRPRFLAQHQRHARGLAGAGRRDQHGDIRRPQRRSQRGQGFVDGKRGSRIMPLARIVIPDDARHLAWLTPPNPPPRPAPC